MEAAEFRYWVVQPLTEAKSWKVAKESDRADLLRGFHSFFFKPYISRHEYEHPARSLKELYDAAGGAPVIRAYQITAEGTSRPVYFVGPEPGSAPLSFYDLAKCPGDMQLWLGAGGATKMPCGFAECFHGETPQIAERWGPIVAWWAIESKFMFALDPTMAENLLEAIRLEATTHATFGGRTPGWG
jgi:hypothetical protein